MDSAKHKRLLREQRERKFERKQASHEETLQPHHHDKTTQRGYNRIYHDHYKRLLFITFGILFLSLLVVAHTYFTTGDIFYKGVSLSGGITVTVGTSGLPAMDVKVLEERLRTEFSANDVHVREINDLGTQKGITIEASTKENNRESLDAFAQSLLSTLSKDIPDIQARASTEVTGPSLGDSFFRQTIKAVLIAFVFMGLVVFLYFGETAWQKTGTFMLSVVEAVLIWYADSAIIMIFAALVAIALLYLYINYSIPSTAVILAAFSTIMFTIAVVDLFQMRISTAGVAGFLMLIGYSVDTDILLSTRVLKSSSGTVYERIVSTMKTGLTMTGTTFAAALVSVIFTQSAVIREIMTIICIGIVADIFYTWIQNSGILRMYLEHKGRKSDDA